MSRMCNSGDCADNTDGRNCCKEDGTCGCCEGYYFDVVQNKCLPKPKCTKDSECPPCHICVDGLCTPIDCPDGFVCNPETGDCEFNPCPDQPCSNGAECGEDCGCLDGMCVPCQNMPCDQDCIDALGCKCVGTNCLPTGGCSGSCVNGYECAPGCTCFEGQCVPCSNFPCTPDECSDRPNCACVSGTCGPDTSSSGCTDSFELIKIDEGCDLEARLNSKKGCSCPVVTVGIQPTSTVQTNDYNASLQISLHKGRGPFTSLPKLGEISHPSIAENERPTVGTICMDLVISYDVFDQGVLVSQGSTTRTVGGSLSFANGDTVNSASFLIPKIGSNLAEDQIVSNVKLRVKQCGIFDFPNGCTYSDLGVIYEYNISADSWAKPQQGELTTDDTRYPRFVWYRSADNVFTEDERIRDLYITPNLGGLFVDTLYGPDLWDPISKQDLESPEGLLIPNRYYQVMNDCSCAPIASSEKIFFCESDIINLPEPTITQCGRRLTMNGDPEVCDVNRDLSQYTDINNANYPENHDSITQWTLYVNGTAIETFRHDTASGELRTPEGLEFNSYSYTNAEPITDVSLRQDNSNCRTDFKFDNSDLIPVVNTSCEVGKITAKFLRSGYADDVTLESVAINGFANVFDGTFFVFSQMESDREYTYTATFSNGCTYEGTFKDTCCEDPLVDYTITCQSDGTADVSIQPNVTGVTTVITDKFDQTVPNSGLTVGEQYTLTSRLNDSCITTQRLVPDCCTAGSIKLDSISPSPFCNSEGTSIQVSGTAGVTFTLGVVLTQTLPVVGQVDICASFATNQVIPQSGVTSINWGPFIDESVVNLQNSPVDVTISICEATNPGADCDVDIEVQELNTVIYPEIEVTNENITCNQAGTEWSVTFNAPLAESATATQGTASIANGVVTVSGVPSGVSTSVTLQGENEVCDYVYTQSKTCDCPAPVAPNMTGTTSYCDGDPITPLTASNAPAGVDLQVSTDQVTWTTLGSLNYTPPSISVYYLRYFDSGNNCPGAVTTVTLSNDTGPTIVSTAVIDNCNKIQLGLSANHVIGTDVKLYNAANCDGAATASLVNPSISANVVTFVVPAGITLDSSDWVVKYGACSCEALDTVTPGCGTDCDCVVELTEDPDNDCNLRIELNGSGCGTYNSIEITDESETTVFTANNPTDNYGEDIGPEGDFPSLIPLVSGEEYTLTVSGPGCSSKTDTHTLDCLDCTGCPENLTVDIGVTSGNTAPSWAGVYDLIWLTDVRITVRECPTGEYVSYPLWSGGGADAGGAGGSGKEEALVYIQAACDGSEQALIDAHFGDTRTLVTYQEMVDSAEAELQEHFPGATLTLSNDTQVTVEGVPCLYSLVITAYRRELTTGPCALDGSGSNPYGITEYDLNCECES